MSGWQDQDGAKVVDVGERGAGLHQIAQSGEKGVSVIIGKVRFCVQAVRGCALQRVRSDYSAGIVFGAIYAICVSGQSEYAGLAPQRKRQRQEELDVTSAAS